MARRGALGNDNPCSDLQSGQRTTRWMTARIAITLAGDGDGTRLEIAARLWDSALGFGTTSVAV